MKEDYHIKSIEKIFKDFQTSKKGLTETEAKNRLEKYGKNISKGEKYSRKDLGF